MSFKEEQYVILENEGSTKFLVAEVIGNEFLLTNSRNALIKGNANIHSTRKVEDFLAKKEGLINEIQGYDLSHRSFTCGICQVVCNNCKGICVTCKSPCKKCNKQACQNSTTDTHDFDKYLESLSKKVKPPVKVKTIGTDTCDLEAHFDYYKSEKKNVLIQKHVATDCIDLILRKPVTVKKPVKHSVAVDTHDLNLGAESKDLDSESDCEFFWNIKEEVKTYSKKLSKEKISKVEEKQCEDSVSENLLVIDEGTSCVSSVKDQKFKLGVLNSDDSSSEDSDIDLATSSKIAKCQKLAREHNITLKRFIKDQKTLFQCSICCETFFKKREGILHLGNHIDSNFLKCLTCNDKFENLELLYVHVKENHNSCRDDKSKNENKENSESFVKPKTSKMYLCIFCPELQKFDSYKGLNLHKKEIHGISRIKENKTIKEEKKPRIKREHICLICGKQFKSSKALKDHSPVHTGEKNYQCDICKKSYTTSANLKIHKRTHTGAKNFVCSVCGKAFHKKDSLKVHFRKHSGERPFQCDLCPMKFDRNYILKNHRYTHFSEKKFICPVCGKTFTTHGGLNNHEKGHKKDPFAKKPRKPAVKPTLDAENAVICDVCGKIYSTRSNLRIHKFVHLGVKPFECTICHQTYAKKDSMLTHMRKHTDERPFACETCGMTFYRNHTLKTHLLRHTGERPHKCKMCGKSFTQSSSLAYHLKNHDRKVEKKKIADDPMKVKKKRLNHNGNKLVRGKKTQRIVKIPSGIEAQESKSIFGSKKTPERSLSVSINLPDGDETQRGTHFMVQDKEILILDKQLGVELSKNFNPSKDADYFGLDKEISYGTPVNTGKFNYYIAKSHVFSLPKESTKVKKEPDEVALDKNEGNVENLIISKNSYITKEGNLVTLNRDSGLKDVKEFIQIEDERLDLKPQSAISITGEILNAAFISDENGDVIPLSTMTLQSLNAENVMISPLIPAESEERKGFIRNSKLTMVDSKIYNLSPSSRILNEKIQSKGNYHIINLKDSRVSPKIEMGLESTGLQVQGGVDDGTIHGIPTYYNNV